ncbi:acyl-protein synthetase [Caloramator proteoclasticus]|uniref:Acyl-protein synthetase, LuxE n=1 Tax=Caloramator proteoclasticus DSM 10124 TaxID=1121262 RepID=A0A1M4W6U6_9CLOT|nr:acyl-protein synthetase [Caloramator proteoclasticus]SHE76978.1 Acyl-protein synthetase, LuxE [Caloramator proteoclasticus DSM 10124]
MNFFNDFKKNLEGQYEECTAYRELCKREGFNPFNDLKTEEDLQFVPFIMTTSFKRSYGSFTKLLRVGVDGVYKWTVSSSTSGDPSIVGRSKEDIENLRKFVLEDEIRHRAERDYECTFFPRAEEMKAFNRGLFLNKVCESYLGNIVDIYTYLEQTIFLLKLQDGKMVLDIEPFIQYIKEHNGKNHRAALGGSTPLIFKTVLNLKEKMKPVELGDRAILHTGGGGWDGRKGNINIGALIERWRFVEEVSNFLGIPQENFTDTYSFTENSFTMTGHYSREHRDYLFHVPEFARVIVRDIKTLKPVKEGERGFIQVLNAYGTSAFAGASILVDDIGEVVSYTHCPECGYKGMVIKLLGRVKGTEAKGCGATLGGDGVGNN